MTAKQEEKRDQRAIVENKRLTVKRQKEARDERARHRGKMSKEKQFSRDSCPVRRRIKQMVQLNQLCDKQFEEFFQKYGHSNPDVSDRSFVEKPFGSTHVVCDDSLASSIVSLALFDEKEILFACSGIAIKRVPTAGQEVLNIVTSKRLITEFNNNRNRDDGLRIRVLLPPKRKICINETDVPLPHKGDISIKGYLGLYDEHIAIVTCFYYSHPCSLDMDSLVQQLSDPDSLVALGRAFNSGTLMSVGGHGSFIRTANGSELIMFDSSCAITEAGIGGPVTDKNGHFLGLNIDYDAEKGTTFVLSWQLLRERLQYFEKYTPSSSNYRDYTLPEDLYSVVPSGFWNNVSYLSSMGYPKPPPLVLESGGSLCDHFEEDFGELYGYEGLGYNPWCRGTEEDVFSELQAEVLRKICRRVVLLTSYNGDQRSFACTGYLIKWHKKGTTVVLTSASLIRSPANENMIDENLKIDVFLPPNQHATGALELYHLDHNIAIISVHPCLRGIHPENIFRKERPRKKVLALGREVEDGVLMGTTGVVSKMPLDRPGKLGCKELELSTCNIKKAGIGGPLVNFIDGSYAGMNFYDGTNGTPYLPRRIIAKVLSEFDLPSQTRMGRPINVMSESTIRNRLMGRPVNMMSESTIKNRWPVPKPYWYHSLFDVSIPLGQPGRQLQ